MASLYPYFSILYPGATACQYKFETMKFYTM
jgi:hypothetical protein